MDHLLNVQTAQEFYQARRYEDAERLCRSILNEEATHFEALNLLGVICAVTGQPLQAADWFRRAIAARPHDAAAHNNYGNVLKRLGRLPEALECYRRALAINPVYAEAHNNLGNCFQQMGRLDEALNSYRRALQINPQYGEAHYNSGVVLQAMGSASEALSCYDSAVKINSNYLSAHNNRGILLRSLGRLEEAVECHERALVINPEHAESHNNYGNALRDLRRFAAALTSCERALQLKPDYPEAYSNRGNVLQDLRRFAEALACYDRALQLKPDYAETYNNRGGALQGLGRLEDAAASYERALQLKPSYAEAHNNLGGALRGLRRFAESLGCYDRALQLKPDYAEAYNNRGVALQDAGQFDAALENFERALQLRPDYADAYANRGGVLQYLNRLDEALESYEHAFQLNPEMDWLFGKLLHTRMFLCAWDALECRLSELRTKIEQARRATPAFPALTMFDSVALQRRAAHIWAGERYPASSELAPIGKRSRREKIRIGYFSSDFREHAVSHLVAELLERHDRDRFELFTWSFGPGTRDAMRNRIASVSDRFLEVGAKSDKEVAQASRELEIDIAVDLNGFTLFGRPGIFARRAAPVQVSYLGYPGTMSVPYMDYLIADKTLIPGEHRHGYSEKVAYLPNSFLAVAPPRAAACDERARQEFALPATGFVFCCFNQSYKISPRMFDIWMRVLKQVEGSVLWLAPAAASAISQMISEAEARGVSAARLIFAAHLPLREEHLNRLRVPDLFLDTSPYNAHATTCDALGAGLPVLTWIGESFAARVAASLLAAADVPELVVTSAEEYETLAIELAQSPARLAATREKIRTGLASAPLFDTTMFARHLEDAYSQMYDRHHRNLTPVDIVVAPRPTETPAQSPFGRSLISRDA